METTKVEETKLFTKWRVVVKSEQVGRADRTLYVLRYADGKLAILSQSTARNPNGTIITSSIHPALGKKILSAVIKAEKEQEPEWTREELERGRAM